jgi:tRNA dimethylallyltransferase
MSTDPFRRAIVLTGPTGSGKTRLALTLADRLGAEIVSMDSMALYRGMDVGTAKPMPEERCWVPHHLIDVLDPWESASVAWWLERAAACCREIEARGRRVLIVGGTPLYLKALLRGLFDGPPADETLRRRLTAEAEEMGCSALHSRLAAVDPATAARLHPNDVRRVVRALEVWELTGKPMSAWQTQWRSAKRGSRMEDRGSSADGGAYEVDPPSSILHPRSSILVLCLDLPREHLYAHIDARVRQMFAAGLVEEVRALQNVGHPLSREASQALGYKETFAFLAGQATLEETIVRIQTRTRQFAKRQLTWFRHLPECQFVAGELTFATLGLTIN